MTYIVKSTRLKVVPYLEVDGVRTFRDSDLREWWHRMQEDGSGEHVFRDGSIKTADEFLWQMKMNPDCQLYVGLSDNDPAMISWLNYFQYHHCQAHFCAFKKFWGNPILIELGKMFIETFFRTQDVHMIIGLAPADNFRARNYLKSIGAKELGMLPQGFWNAHSNQAEDARLFQALRSDYESLH